MINSEMLAIAKELVQTPSINSTPGEKMIGLKIEKLLRDMPYFQKHPELVFVKVMDNDALERRSVMALLIGEKSYSKKTLIFHGHTDTVGLEGFGTLEPYAFDPDVLIEKMKEVSLPAEVLEDLKSGDYMFGRGACDMKSGDAVFLGLIKKLSEHPEELDGNILVSFNPVEETGHFGIIDALQTIIDIRDKYNLEYVLAVNNDYICPLYKGDPLKTIYTGVVGKAAPCFYIQGKETHVGQVYEGLDASFMAAKLVEEINFNRNYSDNFEGEWTYPPSVLKMRDLKPWYNVQTPKDAFLLFHYSIHNKSIKDITEQMKAAALKVFKETVAHVNSEFEWFCQKSGQEYKPYSYKENIFSYDELKTLAKANPEFSETKLDCIMKEEQKKGTELREIPLPMIKYLLQTANITDPAIVVFYATPFCPHNTMQKEDSHFIDELKAIAEKTEKETGDKFRFMKFFQSLSDSSYFKCDDDEESLNSIRTNYPGFDIVAPMGIEKIKQLNVPTVNYGCYGKDAHKWTERVNLPYTFEVLPVLLMNTIDYYLR